MSDPADDSDGPESRRKRIRQACLNCRRKKVRCGGEKPICNFCRRLSQTCVYVEDGRSQRRGSASHTGGYDELSDSIMETINLRFSALEEQMEERLSRIESTIDKLASTVSSSIIVPPPQAQQSFHSPGFAAPLSKPQTVTEVSVSGLTTLMSGPNSNDQIPPIHTLLFAADVYFRFCHNQPYSLFHEATFRRRLVSNNLPKHLVWALLAAARRYSTLPDLQFNATDDALVYAKRAWECLELPWNPILKDEEVVPVIQTIILIVNIEHPAGLCTSSFMKLGFALRIALLSKLHLESEAGLPTTFREERKRTFWSLYLQDKLISLSKERFPMLRDEECKIQLPCTELAFKNGLDEEAPLLASFTGDWLDHDAAESCCPLALIAVMASTLNRVSNYVMQANRYSQVGLPWSSSSPYAAISSTLLQLEHYFGLNGNPKESLERRCFVDGAIDQHLAGSFIYSKALFHLAHCLLHHPFLIQQRLQLLKQRAPTVFLKTAWDTCLAHAKSLTDLKDVRNHNVLILTSLYGYCTMVAGTIHVISMNDESSSVRESGNEYYRAALEFLRELSCYWKHAGLMANRLERFRHQCEDRRQELDPCAQNAGHSPGDIKVLWQSVDYALLSTPTRPGSPALGSSTENMNFFTSPSSLFDFADFSAFADGIDIVNTLPLVGSNIMLGDNLSQDDSAIGDPSRKENLT